MRYVYNEMNLLLAPTLDSSIKFYTESNNVSIIRFGPFIPMIMQQKISYVKSKNLHLLKHIFCNRRRRQYFLYPRWGMLFQHSLKYCTTILGSLSLVKISFLLPWTGISPNFVWKSAIFHNYSPIKLGSSSNTLLFMR